jgi:hypothetical protein
LDLRTVHTVRSFYLISPGPKNAFPTSIPLWSRASLTSRLPRKEARVGLPSFDHLGLSTRLGLTLTLAFLNEAISCTSGTREERRPPSSI